MSHQPYPQQQPGWATPPPQQTPPPKKKRTAGNIAALGCLGIVGLFLVLVVIGALVGNDDDKGDDKGDTTTQSSAPALTDDQRASAAAAAGLPPEPTGADRQELLDALAEAAPDVVRYEDKAVDAARNQCSAISGGSTKVDWTASQRFTYEDVTTTEAQGKKINAALKRIGFCDV